VKAIYLDVGAGRVVKRIHPLAFWLRYPIDALCSIGRHMDFDVAGELEHQGQHFLAGEWRERYTLLAPIGGFFYRLIGRHHFAARARRARLGWGGAAFTDPVLTHPDDLPF